MDHISTQLSYGDTGYFSNIIDAYLRNDDRLAPFFQHPVSTDGLRAAIRARSAFANNRELLVAELKKQYDSLPAVQDAVNDNIRLLLSDKTFTVCTAHQPALFTGNLFFVYKILHTIRLARKLAEELPEYKFVPVFYMGCEDADLDELGHVYLNGEKISWDTKQKGAVGRMKPAGLDKLINRIDGELSVLPFGSELTRLLRACYLDSENIQTATFKLVNELFGQYGLVVLIPDSAALKEVMVPVFEDELFNQATSQLVERTGSLIAEHFKVQAHPREINLFYLEDGLRERIERDGDRFRVVNTELSFSEDEIREELRAHPERFSPNVILRGLFQETILPNIAFIGGGGELAYWMELTGVFDRFRVPYPVLVLRNSFLVIEKRWHERMDRLQLDVPSLFLDEHELFARVVKRDSEKQLTLAGEITDVSAYYEKLKSVAAEVDDTLKTHVAALQTRAIRPLHELEKKLLRAEKKKFEAQQRQLASLRAALFPNNSLQERVENFMPFYAKWGSRFISMIFDESLTLEQKFVVITLEVD